MSETGTDSLTRMLTRGRYAVVAKGRASRFWLVVLPLLFMVSGAVVHAVFADRMQQFLAAGHAASVGQLTEENQKLQGELEQMRMMQEHDRAALAALQKNYEAQAESLRQASRELSFYRKNAPANVPVN